MSDKGTVESEKEEGTTANRASSCCCNPHGEAHEERRARMQEMMSRCMASFGAEQREPPKSRAEGGDDREDK